MTDRYTRVVLTIVALCLVWICMRDVELVKPAQAQMGRYDNRGRLLVNVEEMVPVHVSGTDGTVRVEVTNSNPMRVWVENLENVP